MLKPTKKLGILDFKSKILRACCKKEKENFKQNLKFRLSLELCLDQRFS
jgi:hypothetical protein